MVAGGMVSTVSGPISSSTYITSRYSGFLVLVLAHSGLCTRAPCFASAAQRGPANFWPKRRYASFALAMAARPFSILSRSFSAPSAFAIKASRRLSISVSTRLTKKLATEARPSIGRPAFTRSSRPAIYASITRSCA